jgi:hypothetical protein
VPFSLCFSLRKLPAIEPAQTLNVDLSTLSAATDVALGFGDPIQEIADINFQSGPDADVAARLYLYNAAFHLKYRVPVRSILVLLRPKAQTPGLNGRLTYVSGRKRVNFPYEVVRLWKQPVEPFLQGGLGLLPLAPLCKMPEGKPLTEALREIVREIDRRLAVSADHARAVRLMTAAFILTGLRVQKEQVASIYEGVKIMHESVAWDQIEEEGFVKGELAVLVKLARKRFGEPSRETLAALSAIQDRERVERMVERMTDRKVKVRSWEALFAIQ